MPLFVCDQCNSVDNTACGGNFWARALKRKGQGSGMVLCAECHTGKWHGLFDKRPFIPENEPSDVLRGLLTSGYVLASRRPEIEALLRRRAKTE